MDILNFFKNEKRGKIKLDKNEILTLTKQAIKKSPMWGRENALQSIMMNKAKDAGKVKGGFSPMEAPKVVTNYNEIFQEFNSPSFQQELESIASVAWARMNEVDCYGMAHTIGEKFRDIIGTPGNKQTYKLKNRLIKEELEARELTLTSSERDDLERIIWMNYIGVYNIAKKNETLMRIFRGDRVSGEFGDITMEGEIIKVHTDDYFVYDDTVSRYLQDLLDLPELSWAESGVQGNDYAMFAAFGW